MHIIIDKYNRDVEPRANQNSRVRWDFQSDRWEIQHDHFQMSRSDRHGLHDLWEWSRGVARANDRAAESLRLLLRSLLSVLHGWWDTLTPVESHDVEKRARTIYAHRLFTMVYTHDAHRTVHHPCMQIQTHGGRLKVLLCLDFFKYLFSFEQLFY